MHKKPIKSLDEDMAALDLGESTLVEDEGDVPIYLNPSQYFKFTDHYPSVDAWKEAVALLNDALDDKPTYAAIQKAVTDFLKKKVKANAKYKVK